MKVIKEKNFIIFENENGKISKLDMNTGIAYGVSGKALKNLNNDIYFIIGHHARRYSKDIFALRAFADSYFSKNDIYTYQFHFCLLYSVYKWPFFTFCSILCFDG